ILRPPEKRQRRDRASSAFLQCKCDDTGGGGKDEQGNLFQKKSLYYAPLIVWLQDFRLPGWGGDFLKTTERPVIQNEKDNRGGYQHGLGHKPCHEQRSHREIARHRRRPRITNVCVQHEKKEYCTENVFSLAHPCYRLDVQRVNGK